ncbi:hypothetical protein HWV62_7760 [Athelia sp. TMB]|nr:hypothetical protein HWV62_7744 [Athelia sp. TMB]KAF7985172.1 hypothetical protein HWV62_7760 [Athelia sp. TMB]
MASHSKDSTIKNSAAKPTQQFRVRFAGSYKPKTTAKTGDLSERSQAAQIYTKHLKLDSAQECAVDNIHSNNLITDRLFRALNAQDQHTARAFLAAHNLNLAAREDVRSRWSVRWTRKESGQKEGAIERVLYQCDCGYDHVHDGRKKRHNAFNFTGCLAHVEVTVIAKTRAVLRVRGHFEHNAGCQEAVVMRMPELQVHPSVYVVALAQLLDGASPGDIRAKNRALVESCGYSEQPRILGTSSYRWLLKQSDFRTLYRQYHRVSGVNVTEAPHINLDEWLSPQSPLFNRDLAKAIFHYSPRAAKGDRFEICIATPEMHEASWRYGHKSQIILDGTFGLCDKRLLLFIVMGLDEERKGVPLAFLMFSAPSGNRQTSAGYNTAIIQKLLQQWKHSLGRRNGETFIALVAITDTDLIERAALLIVFPGIWLLICKFHLRQSWRNHRNREVKGKSPGHKDIKARLRRLEEALVKTTSIEDANAAITHEREVLETLQQSQSLPPGPIEKGISHLNYLSSYWLSENLWKSWSDYGRHIASGILQIPFEGVLPTTNHLESFNGLLKNKHIKRWQRGGRRLRVDVLVKSLATQILPAIFAQRSVEKAEKIRIDELIRSIPGGAAVLAQRDSAVAAALSLYCYLTPDTHRDGKASIIMQDHQLSSPTEDNKQTGFFFVCYSSLAIDEDSNSQQYNLWLGLSGQVFCECKDFNQRGGACKHIRAAVITTNQLRSHGIPIPDIPIPRTLQEARDRGFTLTACEHASGLRPIPSLSSPTATLPTINIAPVAAGPLAKVSDHIQDLLADTDEFYEEPSAFASAGEGGYDSESDGGAMDSGSDSGDEFDFVVPDSAAALNEQAIGRVFIELDSAMPKLGSLGSFLGMVTTLRPDDVTRAKNCRDHLLHLADMFSRLLTPSTSPPHTPPPSSTPLPMVYLVPPVPSLPRKRALQDTGIIAISPEKKQNRKNSYGIH